MTNHPNRALSKLTVTGHIYTAEGWKPYDRRVTVTDYREIERICRNTDKSLLAACVEVLASPTDGGPWHGKIEITGVR